MERRALNLIPDLGEGGENRCFGQIPRRPGLEGECAVVRLHLGHAETADEPLLCPRLVDDPELWPRVVAHGDQNTPRRRARHIGAGTIDRVQHPCQAGRTGGGSEFLTQNGIVGPHLGQNGAHRLFGGAVGHGHGIKPLIQLVFSLQVIGTEIAQRLAPRGIGHTMGGCNQIFACKIGRHVVPAV